MICRKCNNETLRIDSGRKNKNGSKVYVDSNGLRWNGRECPSCKYNKKEIRAAKVARCGHVDSTRYFVCSICKPELERDCEYLYC
jgi:hypothetical protein